MKLSIIIFLFIGQSLLQVANNLPLCPTDWICKWTSATDWKAFSPEKESVTIGYNLQAMVSITCDPQRDTDLPTDLLSNFTFPINVSNFYFGYCPLPQNTTFASILSGHNVQTLRLWSERPFKDSLSPYQFEGLDELTSMNLAGCGVTSLPNSIFEFIPKLEKLTLTDNNLSSLEADMFENATNLEVLGLGNNQLTKLSDKMPGLNRLKLLYLQNNRITNISKAFFSSMPSLQIVDIQGNQIASLEDDLLKDVPNLKIFKMFGNKLQYLPVNLFPNQTQLTEIDLSDNPNITEVPLKLLHSTRSLLSFSMNMCGFSKISLSFFDKLANLTSLSLTHNRLSKIEHRTFAQLTNLTELNLSFNQLTEIDKETFAGLKKLITVNLKRNHIRTIDPAAFVYQSNLKILNLAFNQLETIEESLLMYTANLDNLDLSHNKLTYLDQTPKPFGLPSFIRIVNLAYNRFRSVPSSWILENTMLNSIDLRYNELSYFDAMDVQPTSNNFWLDISFNNISRTIIQMGVINQLMEINGDSDIQGPKPKVIFENNPYICDCESKDLLQYYINQVDRNYPFQFQLDNLLCISPPQLMGLPFTTIQQTQMNCITESNCPKSCHCVIHAVGSITEMNCNAANLTTLPAIAPHNTSVLILRNNLLTNLSTIDDIIWSNLTQLYLTDNDIDTLDNVRFPSHLQVLDLRGNKLNVINKEILIHLNGSTSLQSILLQNNPWNCENCDNALLRDFLNENIERVGNVSTIVCDGSKHQLYLEPICVSPPGLTKTVLISTVFVCFIMAMGLAAAAIAYYRYNHEIKVWLYAHRMCLWMVKEKELDKNKRFDAFISFSQEDAEFVSSHLMPGLEDNEPYYKLCIHHRDWLAGEWIPDQIIRSVQDSRRTIVVLSKNFIKSVWGRLEFKAAHHQALQDRTNRIIILVVGDLPPASEMDPDLKMYVKFNTYVKWGDDWFWQKLRYAMPHCPVRSTSVPPPSFRSLSAPKRPRQKKPVGDPNTVANRLAGLK